MVRRTFYRLTQPQLVELLDLVKTNTSYSYTLDSAKKQFSEDFVKNAVSKGFVDIKDESIGIAVGDWSPTHEVLKLTKKSKPIARTHQEKEKTAQSRSEATQKIIIRVIAGLITAILLYVIGSVLSIQFGS